MGNSCVTGGCNGSVASGRQDDASQGSEIAIHSFPDLPEEIWHHIHSLLPMRDAARAACVSHGFLHSWRCHPNLTFTLSTVCSRKNLSKWTWDGNHEDKRHKRIYNSNIDNILANHRGASVKAFELQFYGPCNTKSYKRLNSWLDIAITPVLEELTLYVFPQSYSQKSKYDFPCSLLSDGSGNRIRHLSLFNCVLHPTVNLSLRCLTELSLSQVSVTGDELWRLLSSSSALEKLELRHCGYITRLEISCLLQRFSCLEVVECSKLELIENKAPNISYFHFTGEEIQLSLGESLQVKNLRNIRLDRRCVINYAIDKLPSSVPNLETLTLCSRREIIDAPVLPRKFIHLKVLSISIRNWTLMREYDFLSLVSFLDASPSLETFGLSVSVESKYDLIVGDPSTLRQMPERHHDKLKTVRITGFCRQKSMVELTLHILESAASLKHLTLIPFDARYRLSGHNRSRKCPPLNKAFIREVHESIMAVKTYIEGKVPSKVQLEVFRPCSECHAL